MVTVVYCTRETNPAHKEHLIKSSGLHKNIEVIEIINKGESLTVAYNRGLKQAKNNIVVFCHDDLTIETNRWGEKLIKQFTKYPEFGVIGVAGSKSLPKSAMWWETKKKMYGRVSHTHEGKTWLSSYSPDMGQDIEEVVVVDGVFFAVDKTKIKIDFNEKVEGFHFYDINFCFDNYLAGVKIGVITLIRINHKSIGITNEAWEFSRLAFSEKFKEHLPVNIKKILRKNEKLKVLIACLNFSDYTGSELYVLELAKGLLRQGCEVSICSNIGNPLAVIAKQLGIKLYSIKEPPGFKLGDGQWKLKTADGEVLSEPNTLYKLFDINFDIIHLNHKPVAEHLLRLYPDTPTICSIHSEIISLEEPVITPQIKKYIAIRPEIKEYLVDKFEINSEIIEVIYNPIDDTRFKVVLNNEKREKKRILFVGTIDFLRKDTIQDLINTTKENNQELWIVGKKHATYLDDMILGQTHVKYFTPTNKVENYIHQCDIVAGIMLGRTTIEGWLCGKSAIIYDVDSSGGIVSKSLNNIPDDIDKFKADNIIKQIKEEYLAILD